MTRSLLLAACLALPCLTQTGCVGAALVDAAFRETDDEGCDSRYPHQSYGEHFLDALAGDDHPERDPCLRCHRSDCCGDCTVVVVRRCR